MHKAMYLVRMLHLNLCFATTVIRELFTGFPYAHWMCSANASHPVNPSFFFFIVCRIHFLSFFVTPIFAIVKKQRLPEPLSTAQVAPQNVITRISQSPWQYGRERHKNTCIISNIHFKYKHRYLGEKKLQSGLCERNAGVMHTADQQMASEFWWPVGGFAVLMRGMEPTIYNIHVPCTITNRKWCNWCGCKGMARWLAGFSRAKLLAEMQNTPVENMPFQVAFRE